MRLLIAFLLAVPFPALAETFDRPVPMAQTGAAEISFLIASIALVLALVAVHLLVRRR